MDVRSFKLRWAERHVRVVVADAAGERGRDLWEAAADRVFAEARPLTAALTAAAAAPVRAASLDLVAAVARLSLDGPSPGLRLAGPEFAPLVPLARDVARQILNELHPRRELPPGSPSDAAFWSAIWQNGSDGWELGRAAPPLARWVAAHPELRGQRALVAGCGRGHEARLLAAAGAQVVAVDITPEAIAAARALGDAGVDFRQRDLFGLPAEPERYDLWLEHCCFCAIDPTRRREYAAVARAVLRPGGRLVGLFWAHGRSGGPPFSVTGDELGAALADFELAPIEIPPDSIVTRAGQELLVEARVSAR